MAGIVKTHENTRMPENQIEGHRLLFQIKSWGKPLCRGLGGGSHLGTDKNKVRVQVN